MDLQELHRRTGIKIRKLRYCIDHELIPGLDIDLTPRRAGSPRRFADDVGFGIVCAAYLLDLHLRHETIRSFLGGLTEIPHRFEGRKKLLLAHVLEYGLPAQAQLSNDGKVRIIAEEHRIDSHWIIPGKPSRPVKDYEPPAFITLDIGKIRSQVFLGA